MIAFSSDFFPLFSWSAYHILICFWLLYFSIFFCEDEKCEVETNALFPEACRHITDHLPGSGHSHYADVCWSWISNAARTFLSNLLSSVFKTIAPSQLNLTGQKLLQKLSTIDFLVLFDVYLMFFLDISQ